MSSPTSYGGKHKVGSVSLLKNGEEMKNYLKYSPGDPRGTFLERWERYELRLSDFHKAVGEWHRQQLDIPVTEYLGMSSQQQYGVFCRYPYGVNDLRYEPVKKTFTFRIRKVAWAIFVRLFY